MLPILLFQSKEKCLQLYRCGPLLLQQPQFSLNVPKNLPDAVNFLALLMYRSKVKRHVLL